MRTKANVNLVGGLILLLLVSACAARPTEHPPTAVLPGQSPGVQATPVPGSATQATGGGTTAQATTSGNQIPADVPILDGAYKLQVARGGRSIQYQVDTDIKTAVTFYQQQMEANGWQVSGAPDTQVGSIAALVRKNANGDQLTVNMQENKIGGFVSVTIAVTRAP